MRRAVPLLLSCSAVLAVAGCGSSGSSSSTATTQTTSASAAATSAPAGPAQSGLVQVHYHSIAIDPANVTVKVGSTIKWTNLDPTDHNVTSTSGPTSFASKDFGQGGTFEMKFTTAGVIHYLCTIHPASMVGTITVVQ